MQSHSAHYLLKDHLGSTDFILDESGQIAQALSFDAWGKRRQATDWAAMLQTDWINFDTSLSTRGYTGHEMLDTVGLIHMNGRIYDPQLGRFAQADPFVQAPGNTQSYNRYSYVSNNPLYYTDPSGYFFQEALLLGTHRVAHRTDRAIRQFFGPEISSMAVAIGSMFCGPYYAACAAGGSYAHARAFGASRSEAYRFGIIGGVSSMAFSYVGSLNLGYYEGILAHATLGGIIAELQGGKFGHGFVSAGLSKAFNANNLVGGTTADADALRVVIAAVVGGTISEATGGKFANGAITAGFAQAFNGNQQCRAQAGCAQKEQRAAALDQYKALEDKMVRFFEENPNGTYPLTLDEINTLQAGFYYHRIKAPGFSDLTTVQQYEIADTILRVSLGGGESGLSGKLFSWQGKTYYGGEVNYLGVGTLAAYRNEIGHIPYAIWAWNNVVQDGSLPHNQRQTVYGKQWAMQGALRYRAGLVKGIH